VLRADLAKRRGKFNLQVFLEAEAASTLVLVGESGSGKTTVLRLLAGLLDPDGGQVMVEGNTWFDSASKAVLPAWRRPVGYVAQDYALFPHLSVFDNVAFGLRALGVSRGSIRARVGGVLERFRINGLAAHRPGELSGGQQQRVALARALVLEPRLLLLDEPLAALDQKTRREVRQELRHLLSDLTSVTVLVTHNPVEALVFGDRVAVMENGKAEQVGSREDLLRHPRSSHIAEFMGVNLVQGVIASRDGSGLARLNTADGELFVVDPGELEAEVFVSISPREITLHREPPGGSAQNVFIGPVKEIIPEPPNGFRVRVALGTHPPLVAEVTRPAVEALGLREGMMIYAAFKATGVVPYR
jgi:molybdate transport system ATP-binding protein